MRLDPWRTLAKDGLLRFEVRAICADEVLIDYSYNSWGEYLTLEAVGEALAEIDGVVSADSQQHSAGQRAA